VVLSLLGLTALTSLSQRWNILSWLAVVVVVAIGVEVEVLVAY
jgi:FtsH-binding integral membrane protein